MAETISSNFTDQNKNINNFNDSSMPYFTHLFDILTNDDDDDNVHKNENHSIEEYNEDFDFDYINTNVDEEEMVAPPIESNDDKIMEEQVLSQKLSQLSAKDEYNIDDDDDDDGDNDYNKETSCNKKRRLNAPTSTQPSHVLFSDENSRRQSDNIDNENDFKYNRYNVPEYLQPSAAITNEFFQKLLTDDNHARRNTNTTTTSIITVEDLRHFAILKHQIAAIDLSRQLWEIYLKSGTGQWETQESKQTTMIDRRLWPVHVKKILASKVNIVIGDRNQTNEDEQKICEIIVRQYLIKFNCTIEQYQNELEQKKNLLMNVVTMETIDKIERLVQQHSIQRLQMAFNYKKTLLECNYNAELLEREFLRLQPTEYQIQHARRLYELRFQYAESVQKLIELKQRIRCNKPTQSMYSVLSLSLMDIDQQQQQQQQLTDSMIAAIIGAEDTIREYRQLFDEASLQLYVMYDKQKQQDIELTQLIYRRLKIIDKKLHSTYTFRINSFLRNDYYHDDDNGSGGGNDGDSEDRIDDRLKFSFLPSLIIDKSLHQQQQQQLTTEQLKLLNRGPTYVSPCQMYVASSFVSMNEILDKQFTLLKHHLNILSVKFHINLSQSMFIQKEIKELFMNLFSKPLPSPLYQRALYEKQLIESIRQHLKMNHLILRRTANQQNLFYLGPIKDFQDKANAYMSSKANDIFEVNEVIDPTNLQSIQEYLVKLVKSMNCQFESIFTNKTKHRDFLNKLFITDMTQIQLPYLYFLPDVSLSSSSSKGQQQQQQQIDHLSLKPVIAGIHQSITFRLSQFLDKLLRPIFELHAKPTLSIDGADFIRKFNNYIEENVPNQRCQRRLRPTTLFGTIKIPNFNTLVSHGTMLNTLQDFLDRCLFGSSLENISIYRILHLTSTFLQNNRFYYDNKIYSFIKGSPNNLSLTRTLSNIYVYQWERSLVQELSRRNEFYSRCQDQIFFTWNETINAFHEMFQTIQSQDPKFVVNVNMDSKTNILNVYLENLDGTLYSGVYHDPNILKYTLPYVIGDATVAHSHWFRSSLIRAGRYCTSVFDFNQERIYLEITFLRNGYSLEFIEQRIKHFFTHFNVLSLRSSLDQHLYDKLRHRLFNFISEQHQISNRNQELENNNQHIHLNYVYQFGPKHEFEKKLQEILFKNLSTDTKSSSSSSSTTTTTFLGYKQIKINLRTKQQYSLNSLLSQQKPIHPLFKEKTIRF